MEDLEITGDNITVTLPSHTPDGYTVRVCNRGSGVVKIRSGFDQQLLFLHHTYGHHSPWRPNTSYVKGDEVVIPTGARIRCSTPHTSGDGIDLTLWEILERRVH